MDYPPESLTAAAAGLLQRARPQHGVHTGRYDRAVYRPPFSDMGDLAEMHDFVRTAGPAHLVSVNVSDGIDTLVSSIVPLLLDTDLGEHGSLVGHLARPNPQWRALSTDIEALAIFTGADAYVSPSFYATKRETGKVVPTWNYSVVHVYGRLVVHDDSSWVGDLVSRLTERHESPRDPPWAVTDAPPEYIESMLRGIVGIELAITRIEGKRKLSQNRSIADVDGVIAGLGGGTAAMVAVADDMRAAAQPRRSPSSS